MPTSDEVQRAIEIRRAQRMADVSEGPAPGGGCRAEPRPNQVSILAANKDAHPAEPPRGLNHEGSSMHTVALRQVRPFASPHLASACLSSSAHTVASAAGKMTAVIAVIAVIAFVMVIASALRGLTTLLTELVAVAAKVTSLLFTAVVVMAVAAVVIVHH